MNKKAWVWVVIGLILAFAAGWFGAQVQNAGKLSPGEVMATSWEQKVMLLVINAKNTTLVNPAEIPVTIGAGLNTQSVALAYVYDGMPQALKKQLALWIPAARTIAIAQQGEGVLHNRSNLLIFADCMQKVRSNGGLLRNCVESHKNWKAGIDSAK
jgi:hypothetical protein